MLGASAACRHTQTTQCPSLFLIGCTRRLAAAVSGGLERPCGGSGRRGCIHPSLLRRLPERGVRLTPGLVPVGDLDTGQDSPCAAGLCHWHIPCYLAAAAARRPKAEQGLSLTAAPTGAPTGATSARPWPRSGSPTVSPLAVPGCLGAPVSRRAESRPRGSAEYGLSRRPHVLATPRQHSRLGGEEFYGGERPFAHSRQTRGAAEGQAQRA